VLSDARESLNRVKKGVIKELFSEIYRAFSREERVVYIYMTFHRVKIWKIWKRMLKKTWSMTKEKLRKRSSEILGVKMEFFF